MLESQSCSAAALVGAKKLPPVVSASSATIALYGSSAPIDRPNASEMIAPESRMGPLLVHNRRQRLPRADRLA
jgi:hypothetical protein